jgi:hypothetical protein
MVNDKVACSSGPSCEVTMSLNCFEMYLLCGSLTKYRVGDFGTFVWRIHECLKVIVKFPLAFIGNEYFLPVIIYPILGHRLRMSNKYGSALKQ